MAIKDLLGFEFDPNEKYPVYQGYSPEEAGMMGKALSDQGINPIFTDNPTQTTDSAQIYTDLTPPVSYAPSDEAMKFAQEQVKFAKYFDDELDKSGNFGSPMYRTPQQEEMKKKIFNEGLKNFSEWYQSQRQEKTYSQGAVTTSGQSVSFNKGSGQWEVSNPDGTKEPWNQNLHGKIQNAMSTTTLPDKSFRDWDKETKDNEFQKYILTGKPYKFSNRDAASTQQYEEEYNQWLDAKGITPSQANVIAKHGTSLAKSLDQQEKQRGAMGNFVRNINKQVDYAEQIFEHLKRTDTRALNIPVRMLRTKLQGSGLEQVYEMYIKEISAEANKLSQGASASIAVLPEGNREEWEKIHDVNMPIVEQRRVFKGTRDLANNRMASVEEEIKNTKNTIENLISEYSTKKDSSKGTSKQPQAQTTDRDISKPITYLKNAVNRGDAIAKIRELSKKGWTRDELAKIVKEAGWE